MTEKKYKYLDGQSNKKLCNANWSEWQIIPYVLDARRQNPNGIIPALNRRVIATMLCGMKIVDANTTVDEDTATFELLLKRDDDYYIAYFDDREQNFYIAEVDYFEFEDAD